MAIVVAYKYTFNPQDATSDSQGNLDLTHAKATVSEDDPVAISLARTLADSCGENLVGVSVGEPSIASVMAKKNALSKGLDSATLIVNETADSWNLTDIAREIARVATEENAHVVITGDSSMDNGARMTPALIAGFLGWPCLQEVENISREDDEWVVTQLDGRTTREVRLSGSFVAAASAQAVSVKPPSMKDILQAAKKPVTLQEVEAPRERITLEEYNRPAHRPRKKEIFDGVEGVAHVVAALRESGILDSSDTAPAGNSQKAGGEN